MTGYSVGEGRAAGVVRDQGGDMDSPGLLPAPAPWQVVSYPRHQSPAVEIAGESGDPRSRSGSQVNDVLRDSQTRASSSLECLQWF